MKSEKDKGQVYTPRDIVEVMLNGVGFTPLDDAQYNKELGINDGLPTEKHIIDNSCGDGAILKVVVERICEGYSLVSDAVERIERLRNHLENFVHGIELDKTECDKCVKNLDTIANKYGVYGIKWDIRNEDALSVHDYDGKMDYVVGNPPYVRVHNINSDSIGEYEFAKGGMTDLYLAFYQLGFRMMDGIFSKMAYISPSSWFSSKAGQNMRDYIMEHKNLEAIIDYGHTQVFCGVTTYCAIAFFSNFYGYNVSYTAVKPDEDYTVPISYEDLCIDGKFYFGTPQELNDLRDVITCGKNRECSEKVFEVKNGYATLADAVFVTEETQSPDFEHKYLIDICKSSTGEMKHCIYPYNEQGKLVDEDELRFHSPCEFYWLMENKGALLNRATTEEWYAFGRTQGINDTQMPKYAISSLISESQRPKITKVNPGSGVYGGLYITSKLPYPEDWLRKEMRDAFFLKYVKLLGKYKSGGYYAFSSKDLENYLNWRWKKHSQQKHEKENISNS